MWLENILLHRPKRWLPESYPSYDELLTAAVEAAVNDPHAPKDLATWRWGAYNAVEIQHPVLGKIPDHATLVRTRCAGTIRQRIHSKGRVRRHGPSERFTANLADLDESTLNVVTGQAGNFLSPYYMDQWKNWYEGTTLPLPFTTKAIESSKAHQLVLEPAKP